MKLNTFGDSWTEGVGGNLFEEDGVSTLEEKTKIRHKYSWPKQLAEILDIDCLNYGVGGSSNKLIFDMICGYIDRNIIKENDLVIIMWSSSLRDELPFFPPDNEWHSWSKRHTDKKYLYDPILQLKKGENELYDKLKIQYKEWYVLNLYNQNYYNMINQGYVLYLQYMFKNLGIRYLFCDAFDNMIDRYISKEIDKSDLIDIKHYWGLKTNTFRGFLENFNRNDIWQDYKKPNSFIGTHPNKTGYKLISEEIYKFLIENNILNYNLKEKLNIII